MSKMIIHKNKGETFKCNLKVDGADVTNTQVRLCMEFDDNKNLFFYGKIQKDGSCSISIPKLSELESKSGKLFIEAIADSVYFKLYETTFDLKNAVEIDFVKPTTKESSIQLENLTQDGFQPVENPKPVYKKFKKFNEYLNKTTN